MQGVPRTALQTLGDELDHTRALLKAASAREAKLERRIYELASQLTRQKAKTADWRMIANRERDRANRRRKVAA